MKPTMLLALGAALLWVRPVSAAEKEAAGPVKWVKTELTRPAAPGARLTAKVHFQIQPGYHTQSHKPSEDYFIPTVLSLKTPAGIRVGRVQYPEGKDKLVVGLDKPMSVYGDVFVIQVPLAVSSQAEVPSALEATLKYQACQGAVCFPPKELSFSLGLEETVQQPKEE